MLDLVLIAVMTYIVLQVTGQMPGTDFICQFILMKMNLKLLKFEKMFYFSGCTHGDF